jgi:hypothetical protein
MKIRDDRLTLHRATSRIRKLGDVGREWYGGSVLTTYGIVDVQYEAPEGRIPYFRVDFVWDGVLHMRTITGRTFTVLAMTRAASGFARAIAE